MGKRQDPTNVRAMMASLAARMARKPTTAKASRQVKRAAARRPAKNVVPLKPALVVDNAPAKPKLAVGEVALARARHKKRGRLALDERPAHLNPFRLPEFPPEAVPKGSEMAMDELPGFAWGANAYPSNVFGEGQAFLGYQYLAELSQRPEYRRISERIATEATRKWIKLQVTGDDEDEAEPGAGDDEGESGEVAESQDGLKAEKLKVIEEEMKRLKVKEAFRKMSELDGFFGRAHLYLDTGDTESREELSTPIGDGRSEMSKGKVNPTKPLLRLKPVEPMWCYPLQYNTNNPLAVNWYRPEVWNLFGRQIHRSRMIPFVSRELPDLLKPAYAFGGLSMSQMAKPYVDNFLRTRQSVSDLISSFATMILSTDLQTTLQAGGDQLYARMDLFNLLRDNRGLMAINKDSEDVKNVTTPLGTLDALQAQSQEQMASVCGIPIVILLGIQPMGLNASSEGEIRVFYDLIAAYQQAFFGEPLTKVINFIQLSKFGEVDPDITFRFEPLWSLDEKGKAEVKKNEAETDKILIDAGVLHPEESRERIASDPESPYSSIDVDDVPEPPAQPGDPGMINPGGDPGGAGPGGGGQPGPKEAGAQDAAILPFGVDELLALDAWSEADHPRGQPGNAGQFGPGGGKNKIPGKSAKQDIHAPQYGVQHGSFTASHSEAKSNIGAPLDVSKLTKVGAQKGSNPGGVYEGEGRKFYVKQGKSKDHVRNEMTAAALYDLAGTPTLKYRPVEGGGHIATEMAKLDKDNASKLSPEERKRAANDFAVHAWLGNWDAVGLGGDNLGTVKGVPTALDLGGAMEYRAQGAPKGKAFGTSVGELDTLRDPKVNKDAANIFGPMTPAEMRASARYVTEIDDDDIRDVVDRMGGPPALADKLIARKADIAERMKTFGAEGDPKKPESTMVVPAGSKMPVKALNGVAFTAWKPPEDWASVDGQMPDLDEPPFDVPPGKRAATGVVITEPDGRVWMVQPTGGYDGYEGVFPKGGLEKGLSYQANAIKEAWEESGLKVKITGFAGDREGTTGITRYYHAERVGGDPSQHEDETEGVVLAPMNKAKGFLNRKRDRGLVARDAAFEESKHPRDDDGKFSTSGGGGSGGGEEQDAPVTSQMIEGMLAKPAIAGGNYRRALIKAIKHLESQDQPTLAGVLKNKLIESWTKSYGNAVKKGDAEKAKKIATKIAKLGGSPPAAATLPPPVAKAVAQAAPVKPAEVAKAVEPPPAKPAFPPPTEAELAKAKKSVNLQLQYVPGADVIQTQAGKGEAQKLVDAFNEKYAGKEMTSQPALVQKVNDFKIMASQMSAIAAVEKTKAAEWAKQQQAEAAKKAAALKAKQEAAAQEAAAKNAAIMKEFGISAVEATGFVALAKMLGGNQNDVVASFKKYEEQAKSLGYPITGFQCALIKNYSDGGYVAINNALRSGSWSTAENVYVKMVNKALAGMPRYTGIVNRGANLSAEEQAKYIEGNVKPEMAFTSTSTGEGFGGNTRFKITAIGKRGASIKKLSNHSSENEVLFAARTFFHVTKVEGKPGGNMVVHMTEMDDDDR